MNNTLTAVAGLKVGHYTDKEGETGCTVIIAADGAVAGVDVRGGAPGTRETDLMSPVNTVTTIHAVMIGGGSAYGLAAADGAMRWLEAQGTGFDVGLGVVPIVPAAALFDLLVGDFKARPTAEDGYTACENATDDPAPMGLVGAGTGATVGKLYGMPTASPAGLGSAARTLDNGVTVSALVAVNAFGNIVDPDSGKILAGTKNPSGEGFVDIIEKMSGDLSGTMFAFGQNTTLAVVATDAVMSKSEATKMAQMAHNGLAQTIRPVHTPLDGDTVFALATGKSGKSANLTVLGAVAADVLAQAVLRAASR
ncbi:MAG: P1 family peptidase [Pseudomonadota bacterium]|nr:P1 family peptidase [Pseudomonadota bacterium]